MIGNRSNSHRTWGSLSGPGINASWVNDTCANGSCCCKCSESSNDTFGPVPAGGGTYSYNITSSYIHYGPVSEINPHCTAGGSGHY